MTSVVVSECIVIVIVIVSPSTVLSCPVLSSPLSTVKSPEYIHGSSPPWGSAAFRFRAKHPPGIVLAVYVAPSSLSLCLSLSLGQFMSYSLVSLLWSVYSIQSPLVSSGLLSLLRLCTRHSVLSPLHRSVFCRAESAGLRRSENENSHEQQETEPAASRRIKQREGESINYRKNRI